jgi:hypothetical protein
MALKCKRERGKSPSSLERGPQPSSSSSQLPSRPRSRSSSASSVGSHITVHVSEPERPSIPTGAAKVASSVSSKTSKRKRNHRRGRERSHNRNRNHNVSQAARINSPWNERLDWDTPLGSYGGILAPHAIEYLIDEYGKFNEERRFPAGLAYAASYLSITTEDGVRLLPMADIADQIDAEIAPSRWPPDPDPQHTQCQEPSEQDQEYHSSDDQRVTTTGQASDDKLLRQQRLSQLDAGRAQAREAALHQARF